MEQNLERNTTSSKEKTGGKKSDEDSPKQPSPSAKKSSKLPPVCLRVDPLPKKKGVNGHSRSPSPPGNKGKSHDSSGKQSGSTMPSTLEENANAPTADNKTNRRKETEQSNSKIEVYDGTSTEKCGKMESAGEKSSGPEESIKMKKVNGEGHVEEKRSEEWLEPKKEDEVLSSDARCQVGQSNPTSNESLGDQANISGRMKLSEGEAAVLIQSAFRGFEVRKREPLKKLKQLAKTKEQMGEIKNRIKALESSPYTTGKDNQRTIITEMIMNLLLKLDTIQGVHPSIRDIRKSAAKELVSLQETLDLLNCKSAEEFLEQRSTISSEENTSMGIEADPGISGETIQDDITVADCSVLRSEQDFESSSAESCQNQPRQEIGTFSKGVENSNPVMANGNLDGEMKKLSGIDFENGSWEAVETGSGEINNNTADSLAGQVPHDGEVEHTFEPQQVGRETTSTIKVADTISTDNGGNAVELSESMQVTVDDCTDRPESSQLTLDDHIDTEASNDQEKIKPTVNDVPLDRATKDIQEFSENGGVEGLNNAERLQVEEQRLPVMSDPEKEYGGEVQEILSTEVPEEMSIEVHETPVNEEEIPITEMPEEVSPELHGTPVSESGVPNTNMLGGVLPEVHEIPVQEQEIPDASTLREVLPELHGLEQEIPNTEVEMAPEMHEIPAREREFPDTESLEKMLPELHEHVQEIPNSEVLGDVLPELHEIPVDVQGMETHEQFPEAKTEIGAKKAVEAFKCSSACADECSTPRNELEIMNHDQPAKSSEVEEPVEAEVLGEFSILENEMEDLSLDHTDNTDNVSLINEEVESAVCEAPTDLSGEHDVGDANNYLEELGANDIGPLPGVVEVVDDRIVPNSYRRHEAVPADTGDGNVESTGQCLNSEAVGYDDNATESVNRHATKQGDKGDISLSSPTASQVSHVSDALTRSDEKLIEENEKLREMMEKLIEAGNKQLGTISSLSGRINDLERRLSRRKKLKIKRPRTAASGSSCLKNISSFEEKPLGLAM